jgi:4-hydroxy-tetrahydrodipicolinate reductase
MRVAIAGAGGKMGRTLIEAVAGDPEFVLAAAFDVGEDAAGAIAAGDVLIDFTRPEGTLAHLAHCLSLGKPMVVGTTGFSDSQRKAIADAARRLPIVLSPNFAIGVNAVFRLAASAAQILGDAFDVEIVEAHHRHKVDAPSGTALQLGEVVARASNRELAAVAAHGRKGNTGERPAHQIGFHAIRGGDIVGEHTVIFAGQGERVELTVRSSSRMSYASGALRAAKWLRNRAPGLYAMHDVLGLSPSRAV